MSAENMEIYMSNKLKNYPGTNPFNEHCLEYDVWFDHNNSFYQAELETVRMLLPPFKNAIEIGVGTGRFALPFGIALGVEPSEPMAQIAAKKGISVVRAFAEDLPFHDNTFDLVLINTVLCFVNNVDQALSEAYRIIKPNGTLLIGIIDKNSPQGKIYEQNKEHDKFFRFANFLSTQEVTEKLTATGFREFRYTQALFMEENDSGCQHPKEGYGEGCYAVISSRK